MSAMSVTESSKGVRLGGEQLIQVVFEGHYLNFIHGGTAREDDDVLPRVEILQLAENGRNATVPIRVRPRYTGPCLEPEAPPALYASSFFCETWARPANLRVKRADKRVRAHG